MSATYTITEFADLDGDGIFDKWELVNFGNLSTANQTTDYDGDGFTNLREYRHGSDLLDPESFPLNITRHLSAGFNLINAPSNNHYLNRGLKLSVPFADQGDSDFKRRRCLPSNDRNFDASSFIVISRNIIWLQ